MDLTTDLSGGRVIDPDNTMAQSGSTGHPDVYGPAEAQHMDTNMTLGISLCP